MNLLHQFFQFIIHLDTSLLALVREVGLWVYGLLFLIIFSETAFVVFPFLPGDSLLFAAGSIAALPDMPLHFSLLFISLVLASIFGNKVNYFIGRWLGDRAFSGKYGINQKYLLETQQFYDKHGGKTIIIARFLPIIRSFAPFVAGIGRMPLKAFSFYNIISAVLWVGVALSAGYFFGSIPFVKTHFSIVIYSIILVSLLPAIITFFYQRCRSCKRSI